MNIIIDTHIFLWALADPQKISETKRRELETATNTIYVSAISVAEMMLKSSIGKLDINFDVVDMVKQSGFELLDFSAEDAVGLKNLPFHHKDPFDRMLVAQSSSRGFALMSEDSKLSLYNCQVI
ncbi:MAG: hypothetical protein AUK35_01070 [Zetaproteobacteria bacterium CG2_30_46_52]|nr:MAG: hypothetical protein AUK35_01070 [Zetaproteobacteria bacterium CG2_30_46_52]